MHTSVIDTQLDTHTHNTIRAEASRVTQHAHLNRPSVRRGPVKLLIGGPDRRR